MAGVFVFYAVSYVQKLTPDYFLEHVYSQVPSVFGQFIIL